MGRSFRSTRICNGQHTHQGRMMLSKIWPGSDPFHEHDDKTPAECTGFNLGLNLDSEEIGHLSEEQQYWLILLSRLSLIWEETACLFKLNLNTGTRQQLVQILPEKSGLQWTWLPSRSGRLCCCLYCYMLGLQLRVDLVFVGRFMPFHSRTTNSCFVQITNTAIFWPIKAW